MKHVFAYGLVVVSLAACSGDADIGIDSQPATCTNVGTATGSGTLVDPYGTGEYRFEGVSPSMSAFGTTDTAVTLSNEELRMQLLFCGPSTSGGIATGTRGVEGVAQQNGCPMSNVRASLVGRIEFLDAEDGTVIIDENSNCLAGRYRVDFGEAGVVAGSFAVAWPQ